MFLFKKRGRVHPTVTSPREKDPVVDTKRKPLFKNFRLRLKLSKNKIEKPENIAEKIQEKTRLQKFANFFKFRGLRKRRTSKSRPPKKALEEPTATKGNCNRLSTNVDENVAVVGFNENDFDGSHQPQDQEDDDNEDEQDQVHDDLNLRLAFRKVLPKIVAAPVVERESLSNDEPKSASAATELIEDVIHSALAASRIVSVVPNATKSALVASKLVQKVVDYALVSVQTPKEVSAPKVDDANNDQPKEVEIPTTGSAEPAVLDVHTKDDAESNDATKSVIGDQIEVSQASNVPAICSAEQDPVVDDQIKDDVESSDVAKSASVDDQIEVSQANKVPAICSAEQDPVVDDQIKDDDVKSSDVAKSASVIDDQIVSKVPAIDISRASEIPPIGSTEPEVSTIDDLIDISRASEIPPIGSAEPEVSTIDDHVDISRASEIPRIGSAEPDVSAIDYHVDISRASEIPRIGSAEPDVSAIDYQLKEDEEAADLELEALDEAADDLIDAAENNNDDHDDVCNSISIPVIQLPEVGPGVVGPVGAEAVSPSSLYGAESSDDQLDAQNNGNLFEEIEERVTKSSQRRRCRLALLIRPPPIAPDQLDVQYAIHDNKFYRADIAPHVERPVTPRPVTPSLCRDPQQARELLSGDVIHEKLDKAVELRNQAIAERKQRIAENRRKFERRQFVIAEHRQAKIRERNEREEKRSKKKVERDAERAQKIKEDMESWQQRYNDMLFLAEKQKLDKELKVERKVAKTDLATRRRDQLVNNKLDKLKSKHMNITFRLEMNRLEEPRPSTAPVDGAFASRQPKNEDDSLV